MRSYFSLSHLKKYNIKEHKTKKSINDFTKEEIEEIQKNYIKKQNIDIEKIRKSAGTEKLWQVIENRKNIRRVK